MGRVRAVCMHACTMLSLRVLGFRVGACRVHACLCYAVFYLSGVSLSRDGSLEPGNSNDLTLRPLTPSHPSPHLCHPFAVCPVRFGAWFKRTFSLKPSLNKIREQRKDFRDPEGFTQQVERMR